MRGRKTRVSTRLLAAHKVIAWTGVLMIVAVLAIRPVHAAPSSGAGNSLPEEAFAPPRVETFTLDNGLEIVAIPDRRAPVVTHMLWYKAGAADEPPGKSGIAHFLEHLMFKGTNNVPAGEFSARVASIGGRENAFTSADYTAYFQRVPPDALEMVMGYEADRMRNLVLVEEDMETERKVVLEERRMRIDANPSALLGEAMRGALYLNHPYGIPVIGWEHEMLGLKLEDALSFYDRFYRPSNAVLVVAGDIAPQEVLELAQRTYGLIEDPGPAPSRTRVSEPAPLAARQVEYADPRVSIPSWARLYLVPSYNTASGLEAEALDLLAAILGDGASSRLYRKLVIDEEIATSVRAGYSGSPMDDGTFSFSATPRGEASLEAIEASIDEAIARIIEEGISQDELDRTRNRFLKAAIYERDSQTSMARMYGAALTTGASVEDIAEWPGRLLQVSVQDIDDAARKYLTRNRSVTSWLRPQS